MSREAKGEKRCIKVAVATTPSPPKLAKVAAGEKTALLRKRGRGEGINYSCQRLERGDRNRYGLEEGDRGRLLKAGYYHYYYGG